MPAPRHHTCIGGLWSDGGPDLFDLALAVRSQRQLHRLRERESRLWDIGSHSRHAFHQHELIPHVHASLQPGVRATWRQASGEIKYFRYPRANYCPRNHVIRCTFSRDPRKTNTSGKATFATRFTSSNGALLVTYVRRHCSATFVSIDQPRPSLTRMILRQARITNC